MKGVRWNVFLISNDKNEIETAGSGGSSGSAGPAGGYFYLLVELRKACVLFIMNI